MVRKSTKGTDDSTADIDIFLEDIERELGMLQVEIIQGFPLKSLLKDKGGLEYEDRTFAINVALEKLGRMMGALSKIHRRFSTKNQCTFVGLNYSPDKRPVHDLHKLIPDGVESLKYEYGPLLLCNNRIFWRINPSLIQKLEERGIEDDLWFNKQIELFDPDAPIATAAREVIHAASPNYYSVIQVIEHARVQLNLTYMTLGNFGRALLKIALQQRRQYPVNTLQHVERLERGATAIYNQLDASGQCSNLIQRVIDFTTDFPIRDAGTSGGRAAPSPVLNSHVSV